MIRDRWSRDGRGIRCPSGPGCEPGRRARRSSPGRGRSRRLRRASWRVGRPMRRPRQRAAISAMFSVRWRACTTSNSVCARSRSSVPARTNKNERKPMELLTCIPSFVKGPVAAIGPVWPRRPRGRRTRAHSRNARARWARWFTASMRITASNEPPWNGVGLPASTRRYRVERHRVPGDGIWTVAAPGSYVGRLPARLEGPGWASRRWDSALVPEHARHDGTPMAARPTRGFAPRPGHGGRPTQEHVQ